MQFLIVGLGNIGDEYADTRHNIGFNILDALAKASNIVFDDRRYGFVQKVRVKNQQLVLLKPSTYMNLSGQAVRYWMQKENIPVENLLVVVDDISLPVGTLRLRAGGSEAGHNGLRSITQTIGTQQYARLRFGIGNDFPHGAQADFVLSPFLPDERTVVDASIPVACDAIKAFALSGIDFAMNQYNKRKP